MNRSKRLGLVALTLLVLILWKYVPWSRKQQGAPKYPVSGLVRVNGLPADGLQIRLFSRDKSLMIQDQIPVGVTDIDGRFQLSSFGGIDGAAEGEYVATFYWPTNVLDPRKDRLQNRLIDPERSNITLVIPPRTTELSPIELEIRPDQLLPAEVGLRSLHKLSQEAASAP